MKSVIISAAVVAALAGSAAAQVIDGVADAGQVQIGVQNAPTSFGNNNLGQIGFANGSELDALYARIDGGNLYLTFAGNLESNFNKFELFIDSRPGGQNQLRGDNPDVDFNGLNRMAGMTFQPGFEPDYWISTTGGDAGGGVYGYFANGAELLSGGGGNGQFLGGNDGQAGGVLSGGNNFLNLLTAIDNTNTAGVDEFSAAGGGLVTTGIEFCIPLASIGSSGDQIAVFAFINGGGHDFVSSQALGGTGGGEHLGEPSTLNWGNTLAQPLVIPAPGSLALIGLGGLLAARRRR